MPYITNIERTAHERGLKQGLLQGIELGLDLKFGTDGLLLMPEISQINDLEILRSILKALIRVNSMDELRALYQN